MRLFILLLLLCRATSAEKHSLKFLLTRSSGLPDFPEFTGVLSVDNVIVGHCDSINKAAEPRQEWMKKMMNDYPNHFLLYNYYCRENVPFVFKNRIKEIQELFNEPGGVHILQEVFAYESDDETGQVDGVYQYAYDGEGLLAFDVQTDTWIALKPQAVIIKQSWDKDRDEIEGIKSKLMELFPFWLKKYLSYGNSALHRRDLPSVSLLQKTPSSPVSCHATGFYPDKAMIFWRKDGEEIHEDVDHGEILPNHDGTFQISVNLNLSSVKPEDWRRYDCVFHLSGVKDDIITILDKHKIRTNWGFRQTNTSDFELPADHGTQ